MELDLWSQLPNENVVYGLKENSMRLLQDGQEAINAYNFAPETKFCYVEVKLLSTDEEQFENIISMYRCGICMNWNLIFKLLKVDDDDRKKWFASGKKIRVNYNIPVTTFWNGYWRLSLIKKVKISFCTFKSDLKIKFVLITAEPIVVDRIGYTNCAPSSNFLADLNPRESVGIHIAIAESHILPFTVMQENSVQMLHHDIDSINGGAGRLYDQNPKKNTKFSYSCAEIFYEGYHKAQLKNGKLDESKVGALTQQK